MRARALAAVAVAAAWVGGVALPARAEDEVGVWRRALLETIARDAVPPPVASRAIAMVHVAVFEAVNAVERRYEPYLAAYQPAPLRTSREAAAACAARDVLAALFPGGRAGYDALLAERLALVPDGVEKARGVAVERAAADAVLALRAADNADLVVPYEPGDEPGEWRPTPPGYLDALLPNWPFVTTWVLGSGDAVRPPPPPALGSRAYAEAYREVARLGRVDSADRTAEQTQIALFWAAGRGTVTPPGMWLQIAGLCSEAEALPLDGSARACAIAGLAVADAAVACWDAKYAYNLWRPVTAIREGDTDGNPETAPDGSWLPLLVTPNFPAYTSGHSTFSGAVSAALAALLGRDTFPFTLTSAGITRSFERLSAAAEEAGASRVYGGIHFAFDNERGLEAGRAIGELVARTRLRPARCAADVNGDGVADSDDVFDFLNAFLAQAEGADFNRDGVVDALDFDDFLGVYFDGCA